MEYVYGTAVLDGVTTENLKVVGGPELSEGEYLTTVREYEDSTITDHCRVGRRYGHTEDAAGVGYDFYAISEHYRYVDRSKKKADREEVQAVWDQMAAAYQEGVQQA